MRNNIKKASARVCEDMFCFQHFMQNFVFPANIPYHDLKVMGRNAFRRGLGTKSK